MQQGIGVTPIDEIAARLGLTFVEPEAEAEPDNEESASSFAPTQFGYENLSYSFKWGEDSDLVQHNEGALGSCHLQFTLTGDISGVSHVLIASWRTDWTEDEIKEQIEYIIPIWKNANLGSANFDGNVRSGFPIDEYDLGQSVFVLWLVLDAERNALGHLFIPVQIPLI